MQSVRFTTRVNPAADLPGRLENLRRMAAPGSGASDNERQTALRLIAKIEAELKASGWTPPPPAPPPSRPSYDYSSAQEAWDQWPSRVFPKMTPIPAAYRGLVDKDLLPTSQKGKDFGFGAGAEYEFVKARYMGIRPYKSDWMAFINYPRGEADGFLLLSKPGPHRDSNIMPILTGFYYEAEWGHTSAGRYAGVDLDLKKDGLYMGTQQVFAIDPADVKKLDQMDAYYPLRTFYTS